jgi:hypothetical protein
LRKAFSNVAYSSEVFGFAFMEPMITFLRFEGRDKTIINLLEMVEWWSIRHSAH